MTLLGVEISDAGIMVAGGEPQRLLDVDEQMPASPGFAIPEKKGLRVGVSAAGVAHLFPLKVINRFWDQLNTDPIDRKSRHGYNHAEIACAHLTHIWENVKPHGDQMIFAVPDYFERQQLGLILGMAQEQSIPVKGFISLSIAASSNPFPDAEILHLDIHLHRFEITHLRQGDHLTREESVAVQEISLQKIYRRWVESIAVEFVRSTRFDPLHQAATEQALYNRLPAALEFFKSRPSFLFEISNGKHSYQISLLRELLIRKSETTYSEIRRHVESMRNKHGNSGALTVLQLTHRIACLPGLANELSKISNCQIMPLDPGAGAQGSLELSRRLSGRHTGNATSFFTSRPWQPAEPRTSPSGLKIPVKLKATHLLYGHVAYPLTEQPLTIGCDDDLAENGLRIEGQPGVSKAHCTVQRSAERIILKNYSHQGTFVDDQRVDGSTAVELGQTVRLGSSGATLRLIACMDTDET